jgi:hypothetical protein
MCAMEQNQSNNLSWTIQDIVKTIPVLIIGMSSIFFVLGLIIVNIHLSQYGIYTSEFVRTEYILAGAVFVFLVSITSLCLDFIIKFVSGHIIVIKGYFKSERYILIIILVARDIIFSTFTLITPVFLAIEFVTRYQIPYQKLDLWVGIFILYAASIYIKIYYALMTNFIQRYQSRLGIAVNGDEALINKNDIHSETVFRITPVVITFLTTSLMALVAIYSLSIYKYVHTSFGGGNKDSVLLFPTPRGIVVCKELLLQLNKDETMVGPLEVLSETEKELIILIPSEITGSKIAMRLNKKMFDAIQTIPSKNEDLKNITPLSL